MGKNDRNQSLTNKINNEQNPLSTELLTLRLRGAMQHFGISDPSDPIRKTADQPTHMVVCGIIGRALGLIDSGASDRTAFKELTESVEIVAIEAINKFPVVKMVDRDHSAETLMEEWDYTALREEYEGIQLHEQYAVEFLCNADFLVTVKCTGRFDAETIRTALFEPAAHIGLGRKDYFPTGQITL